MMFSKKIKLVNSGSYAIVDRKFYSAVKIHEWSLLDRGQVVTTISGHPIYLHSLIMGSAPKRFAVFYEDGNFLNNRKSNLSFRLFSNTLQGQKRGGSSKYKGVSLDKKSGRWYAYIKKSGKGYMLGRYDSEIEAAEAYDKKAIELFGDDAKLNFPKA